MTTPSDSESGFTSEATTKITQDIDETQGQVIAQMMGGLAVGQLTIYLSQAQTPPKTIETATDSVKLGENPYQGLKAFREMDGDRFFGRDKQIKKLWERFQELHGDRTKIRVLPIYGPSGSGKSSLARAGLIPALGKQPLPGQDEGRVVVLRTGNHPLEALATVLARIAINDPTPVAKTREFNTELLKLNTQQEFDGLRRIADSFPEIDRLPLIILVDQFEELYTLCDDEQVRSAFVENLLCAASDRTQRVSVIITMRSDFLGKTQQHPHLNQLFSSQGFLVPIMQPEELALAINEPAKQKGYELDKATVQLLVEQSKGQEGALPLLQFALTQIWEELRKGIKPADTLEQIGGVVGALAKEAKRLYESLNPEQQKIARSIFLALIQLNDDRKATRRRAPISELITSEQDESLVREVIERFARPGVWILVTFSNQQQVEMVEVAHEALIRNWKELEEWLNKHWVDILNKRKIDQAAAEWQDNRKSKDDLLQGRKLRDAREFEEATANGKEVSLSTLAIEFITSSQQHFALTQIWNRLRKEEKPIDTFEPIGGIGGALANEAKLVYDSLTHEQQKIARSIFLALIQLNEDYQNTRRPALISKLITSEQDAPLVRELIDRFVNKEVWILTTFSNEQQVEMVEVAHEALICNWEALQEWLYEQWKALHKKVEIEQFASEWQEHQKSKVYLLQGKMLSDAKEFMQAQKDNAETALSGLAKEFIDASVKKQRINTLKSAPVLLVLSISILVVVHLQIIGRANSILSRDDCKPDPGIKIMLQYMWWTRYANQLRDVKLCNEDLSEVSLPGTTMTKPVFTSSNLSNANFHRAWLQESDFRGVTAAYTDFSNTFLVASDFRCLNDKCTELRGANFQSSKLQLAQFQNSFLKDADFKNADLTDANFDNAKYLTKEKLEGAILCRTKLPDYLNLVIDNKCASN